MEHGYLDAAQPINFLVYDIESFPNFFSIVIFDFTTRQKLVFEVSWRKNNLGDLLNWFDHWKHNNYYMIGFNSIGYDYPMLHEIVTGYGYHDAASIYTINQRIINTPWDQRFTNIIRANEVLIPQIDLFKIHHFDNVARSTSLKKIEFVMRAVSIEESKYPFGVPLPETDEAANETLYYNEWDVDQTAEFALKSWDKISFRFDMTIKYGKDFINHSDGKIGRDYMIMQLKKANVHCYDQYGNKRQTFREHIDLNQCIFPYVQFERPEFNAILTQLKNTVVYETKGSLKLSAVVDGFSFDFGLGGIHGSVESQKIYADNEMMVIDADVTSYYPRLAILNKIFPEHLSDVFCDVYQDVFEQRMKHKKGTAENAGMKLALNVPYGDSNSVYSPFYDPKYTMTVTVNGQLLLCMLAEQLMKIPQLTMIQINTDGLTVKMPRVYKEQYDAVCDAWQQLTLLNLEFVEYSQMLIRDVNNYIAVPVEGKPKFKGAYVHTGACEDSKFDKLDWNKNHSALVIKKATAACVLDGTPIDYFIRNHANIYDFFSVSSVKKSDKLELVGDIRFDGQVVFYNQFSKLLQNNSRYLIVNDGHRLIKTMPPIKRKTKRVNMVYPGWLSKKLTGLNKNLVVENQPDFDNALNLGYVTKDGGTYDTGPSRRFEIEKGWEVGVFNKVETEDVKTYDINYDYYIDQASKLVNAMLGIDYDTE